MKKTRLIAIIFLSSIAFKAQAIPRFPAVSLIVVGSISPMSYWSRADSHGSISKTYYRFNSVAGTSMTSDTVRLRLNNYTNGQLTLNNPSECEIGGTPVKSQFYLNDTVIESGSLPPSQVQNLVSSSGANTHIELENPKKVSGNVSCQSGSLTYQF